MVNFKKEVKEINKLCEEFLNEVEALGNECAYTDRIVEEILEVAKKLQTKYDKI